MRERAQQMAASKIGVSQYLRSPNRSSTMMRNAASSCRMIAFNMGNAFRCGDRTTPCNTTLAMSARSSTLRTTAWLDADSAAVTVHTTGLTTGDSEMAGMRRKPLPQAPYGESVLGQLYQCRERRHAHEDAQPEQR